MLDVSAVNKNQPDLCLELLNDLKNQNKPGIKNEYFKQNY